ncbi:receptor-type adenylate cyclase, partial [Trypanosoma theileri]
MGAVWCVHAAGNEGGEAQITFEFQAEWEKFAATLPQSVIIFGKTSKTTEAFIEKMMSDSRVNEAYVQSPLGTQGTIISYYKAAVAAGTPFVAGRVITTGSNPLTLDTRYEAVMHFQTVVTNYLKNSNQSDYHNPEVFLEDEVVGELMVGGWIAGEIIMETLASS